jgi:hypothetical protein
MEGFDVTELASCHLMNLRSLVVHRGLQKLNAGAGSLPLLPAQGAVGQVLVNRS